MDYGALLQRAWQMTWRYRFLWVLGLFVPGVGGGSGGGNGLNFGVPDLPDSRQGPDGGRGPLPPGTPEAVASNVSNWLADNIGLIILLVVLVLLVVLAFFVVSLIAQGGMARATAGLAQGQPITPGEAWRTGLRLFWRYLGLWLLQLLIGIAIVLLIAIPVGLVALLAAATDEAPRTVFIILGVLLALPLILVAILAFIALSVVGAYAQRAIAVEDEGPVVSLGTGVRLVRRHLGTTALVWLISLGVSIGAGIIIVVGLLVLLLPLGGLGVLIYAATQTISAPLIAYGVVALLLVIAAVWLISAIANTYVWSYWTLAYLALTGRLTAQLQPAPPV